MNKTNNYSAFDKPEILRYLFHPRKEDPGTPLPPNAEELIIPVDEKYYVGGRLFYSGESSPNIIFFHGNGEIVADYDDLAPLFNQMGINFVPVDYRGYGKSNGSPTISAMMTDSHAIYNYLKTLLNKMGHSGPIIIMGRSLGSASALELASHFSDSIDGLIVESGFAYALPLLRLLGADVNAMGLREEEGFGNIDKIGAYSNPTLIIHSQYDQIIPFSDGKALFEASPSRQKKFIMIPDADHNTIFLYGLKLYLQSIKELLLIIRR